MSSGNLRKVGLKVTQPRKRILELLDEVGNEHVTADDVYRTLIQAGEDIGLATVYRVLSQFEAAGLVIRHNFEEGRSLFERSSEEHHDHMVDIESGTVVEFVNDEIEQLQHRIAAKHGYEIVSHNMVLFVRPLNKK